MSEEREVADGEPSVSMTLKGLLKLHGTKLGKNERVYEADADHGKYYVVANSPAQAALAICKVRRVTDKELVQAAFEALGVDVKPAERVDQRSPIDE